MQLIACWAEKIKYLYDKIRTRLRAQRNGLLWPISNVNFSKNSSHNDKIRQ